MGAQLQPSQGEHAFEALVLAWSERGQALPVPVIASVFDDLLAADVQAEGVGRLELADIHIDAEGRASLSQPARLDAFGPALRAALTGGGQGVEIPRRACSILARLSSEDPADGPSSPEQLRSWVRSALGQPAERAELQALLGIQPLPVPELASVVGDVSELATLPPHASPAQDSPAAEVTLPPPVVAAPEGGPTLIDGHPGQADDSVLPTPPPAEHSVLTPLPYADARPVVRHNSAINEPRVSLTAAPAARRTALPAYRGHDRLNVEEERGWWPWLLVGALGGLAGYLLLFW